MPSSLAFTSSLGEQTRMSSHGMFCPRLIRGQVSRLVEDGHQVMVFVHARKETVKTAQKLKEQAAEEAMGMFFDPREHPKYEFYKRDIAKSRNKEMKELFESGFGIHHAGMLREDRNRMERMFEDQAIKVCYLSRVGTGTISHRDGEVVRDFQSAEIVCGQPLHPLCIMGP